MSCCDKNNKDINHENAIHHKQSGHNHGTMMMVFHMVPMFVLFGFYDQLSQPGNRIWLYVVIGVMVLSHIFMMGGMFKHKEQNNQIMNKEE